MGEKYVGPALREVTARRTPAYIMNMILNPQEMVERHPVAKQLLAEHMTFMPNQGLRLDEARRSWNTCGLGDGEEGLRTPEINQHLGAEPIMREMPFPGPFPAPGGRVWMRAGTA